MARKAAKTDTKQVEPKPQIKLELQWGDAEHLEPIFVDNIHLARVNDQFYLTFGQIRLPVKGVTSSSGELRPMVRLVLTKDTVEKITVLLARNLEKGKK
jgi:hypothetical protein